MRAPQAAIITLDVRLAAFENDEREVVADQTGIFPMLDSPLLTIQVILPYTRSRGRVAVSKVHWTEVPGDQFAAPCQLFKIFSDAPAGVC
jgi:hypothetical protein